MAGADGITISLSPGCDMDTIQNVFGGMVSIGYNVEINGKPVRLLEITNAPHTDHAGFMVRSLETDNYEEVGQPFFVSYDSVETIYIY